MTRPPNKRVSRGQPVRRGAPAKKGNGCPLTMLLLPYYLIYALVSLALSPERRDRPQPLARPRAAVGGTAGGGPTNSRRFESEGLGAAG